MKLGSELDGCTWNGCCSVDVVDWVMVVRMVVVLWDGFRYAYYLSVVCLDYSLLLYRIYAYIYCVLAFMHSSIALSHSCIPLQSSCIPDTVVCLEFIVCRYRTQVCCY